MELFAKFTVLILFLKSLNTIKVKTKSYLSRFDNIKYILVTSTKDFWCYTAKISENTSKKIL